MYWSISLLCMWNNYHIQPATRPYIHEYKSIYRIKVKRPVTKKDSNCSNKHEQRQLINTKKLTNKQNTYLCRAFAHTPVSFLGANSNCCFTVSLYNVYCLVLNNYYGSHVSLNIFINNISFISSQTSVVYNIGSIY